MYKCTTVCHTFSFHLPLKPFKKSNIALSNPTNFFCAFTQSLLCSKRMHLWSEEKSKTKASLEFMSTKLSFSAYVCVCVCVSRTVNEGPVRIQYTGNVWFRFICSQKWNCVALLFPKQNYNVLSPNFYIHVSVWYLYIPRIGLPILLQPNMQADPGNI